VNPESKKILLVNTPRDYFVQLHGTTGAKDKLTHAGIYGIEMSKNTLQDLYETDIDYTVRVNFTSLLNLVDALGGISVQSDQAFKADGYNFVAGTNQLNAKQALAFSRERYSFSQGDRQRGKNQQKVIEAVVAKASQPDIIVNYQKILATLSDSFQTNASKDELSNLIKQQLDSVGQWKTESISVDGTGSKSSTYSMGRQALYVMVPDMNTVNLAKTAISSYKATSAQ
jgi:LCP family protein required for cell wall assembly